MRRAPLRLDRRRLLALALAAAAMPLGYNAAFAGTPAARAEAVVGELAGEVWGLFRSGDLDPRTRLERLTGLLQSKTDVALLSRLVLGQHWQRLTEAQQARYRELFGQVVLRNLAKRLNQYASGATGPLEQHFRMTGSQAVGKQDVLVRSTVTTPAGDTVDVDWRLRDAAQGPVIIDLIIEGISLLVSQRSEFAAVIERSDMEGLLTELQARATSES
ncbi:MAG: putative toluene tolerance transporter [Geminicoccaceae bacterium]|nr:putative toluene tolerance transporter [Geminicoccaceae bacterium]